MNNANLDIIKKIWSMNRGKEEELGLAGHIHSGGARPRTEEELRSSIHNHGGSGRGPRWNNEEEDEIWG